MGDFMGNGNGGGDFSDLLILLLLFRGGIGGVNGQDGITNETLMTQGKLDAITASTNAGFANTQMGFAAVAQQLAKCCCDTQLLTVQTANETNRHIDSVQFATTTANTANTQRVVDRVDALDNKFDERYIRSLETQLSACQTRDALGAAVAPINNTLASIIGQLNCGVKSIQYTPSMPVVAPAAYAPYPVAAFGGYPFGGYPHGGCHPGPYGAQGFAPNGGNW